VEGTPPDSADVPNQPTTAERAAAARAASLRAVFASSPRPGQGPEGGPRVPGEITGSWRLAGPDRAGSDAREDAGRAPGGAGQFGAAGAVGGGGAAGGATKRRKRRLWLVPVVIALIGVGGGAAYVAKRGNPFRAERRVATIDPSAGATSDPQPTAAGLVGSPVSSSEPSIGPSAIRSAPISSAPTLGVSSTPTSGASASVPSSPSVTGRPNPSKTDLALHKKAVSLSDEQSGFPAAAAVDGSLTTRWSSGFSDPQWIVIDLGAVWSVTDIKLDWENAYATSYHVDVSVDAKHWSTVFRTVTGKGGVRDIPVRPTPARYVRMYGTERNSQYGYSLKEFEVR